jgi:hypothetical protein
MSPATVREQSVEIDNIHSAWPETRNFLLERVSSSAQHYRAKLAHSILTVCCMASFKLAGEVALQHSMEQNEALPRKLGAQHIGNVRYGFI